MWGYEAKLVEYVDQKDRKIRVHSKIYNVISKKAGYVKYFVRIIYQWTIRALNLLLGEIGADEFMRRAGRMEFGDSGFLMATELAESL